MATTRDSASTWSAALAAALATQSLQSEKVFIFSKPFCQPLPPPPFEKVHLEQRVVEHANLSTGEAKAGEASSRPSWVTEQDCLENRREEEES